FTCSYSYISASPVSKHVNSWLKDGFLANFFLQLGIFQLAWGKKDNILNWDWCLLWAPLL
ncbi:MAG: hypothetical protein AB2693_33415, partial [Candidatus Thiodiazotropha sp.]